MGPIEQSAATAASAFRAPLIDRNTAAVSPPEMYGAYLPLFPMARQEVGKDEPRARTRP